MTSPAIINLSDITNHRELQSAVAGFNEAVLFVDLSPKECYERIRAKSQSHLSLHSIIKYFDTIKVGLQINCDSRDCFYPYRLMRWEKFCHALSQPLSGSEKKNGFISSSIHPHQISTVQPCHLSLLCDFIDGNILSDQDYVEIVSILGEEETRLIYACSPLLSIVDLAQLRADNPIVITSIETNRVPTEQVVHVTSSAPNAKKRIPPGSTSFSGFRKKRKLFSTSSARTSDFSRAEMSSEYTAYTALIAQLSDFPISMLRSLVALLKKQSINFSILVFSRFIHFINCLNLDSQDLVFVIKSVYYLYVSLNKLDFSLNKLDPLKGGADTANFPHLDQCRSVIKDYINDNDIVSFFKNVAGSIVSHPDCEAFFSPHSCIHLSKRDSKLPLSVDISYKATTCFVYLHTKSSINTGGSYKVPYLSVRFSHTPNEKMTFDFMVRYKYRNGDDSLESLETAYEKLKYEYAIYRSMGGGVVLANGYAQGNTPKKVCQLRSLFPLGRPLRQPPSQFKQVFLFVSSLSMHLRRLHKLGFVHRDLKVTNVIFRPISNSYELIDFGATTSSNPEFSLSGKDDCVTTVDSLSINEWIYRLKGRTEYCVNMFLRQSYSETVTYYGLCELFFYFPQLKVKKKYYPSDAELTSGAIVVAWNDIVIGHRVNMKIPQKMISATVESPDWYDRLVSLMLYLIRISSDSDNLSSPLDGKFISHLISSSKLMLNQYLSKVLSDEAVQSKGISLWQFPTPWDDVYALGTMLFSCRCLVSSHHDSAPYPELLRTLTLLITCFTQPNSTLRLHLSSLEGINEEGFNYKNIKEISEADQKKGLST